MSFDIWLAFALAAGALLVLPGPTVLLVVSYALAHGRRAALSVVAGVALGDFVAMTASLAGLGALLATSAMLFTVLKWLGAAYLVWLGIKLWRAPVGDPVEAAPGEAAPGEAAPGEAALPDFNRRRMFGHAFIVTALNPKGIVFFVAFLPQFLEAGRPLLPQFAVMEATFVGLATLNALGFALLAASARRAIRRPAVQRAVNRTGGSLLVAAGITTALWRRAAA